MATGDPKPWHRQSPEALVYRASPVRVAVAMSPLIVFLLVGCVAQYAIQAGLSPGMEWVVGGAAAFVLFAVIILPRINYLEFTPHYFTVRELFTCKRVAWGDIEPGSINSLVRTIYRFPLVTNIGFRVLPGTPYHTAMRVLASARAGMHVYFVNMYPLSRDEIIETLRMYQEWYGIDPRRRSGTPATASAVDPVEPVLGDPAAPGPKYNLIILNDDIHSCDYVVSLIQEVFGVSMERAIAFTNAIDKTGQVIVFTGSLDEVNQKREQIRAYRFDVSAPVPPGSLKTQVVEVQ